MPDPARIDDDLESSLAWEEPEGFDPEDPPLDMLDPSTADRMLLRLALIDRDIRSIHALAEEKTAEIADWVERRVAPLVASRGWLERSLDGYGRMVRARTGAKSVDLPHGKITTTKAPLSVEVVDVAALMAWAQHYGHDILAPVPPPPKPVVSRDRVAALFADVDDDDGIIPTIADDDGKVRFAWYAEHSEDVEREIVPGVVLATKPGRVAVKVKPNEIGGPR